MTDTVACSPSPYTSPPGARELAGPHGFGPGNGGHSKQRPLLSAGGWRACPGSGLFYSPCPRSSTAGSPSPGAGEVAQTGCEAERKTTGHTQLGALEGVYLSS